MKYDGVDFSGQILNGSEFYDCTFNNCNFSRAFLKFVTFNNCTIQNCRFDGAEIHGMQLIKTDIDANLFILRLPPFVAYYTKGKLRIGCQSHTPKQWANFSDDEIGSMKGDALDWWNQYKEAILHLAFKGEEK